MKTISLTISLMIILFSSVALATSVNTDYEGMGDFYMETTITSPILPSITDTVDITTGCEGGCCCCPYCFGEYEGTQIVTNNPFSASGHRATVTEGCIEINQYYYEEIDGQTIATSYYTYFNGTGTAESYVYVVPGEAMSYQLANGTGSSYVHFSQIVFVDSEFDYSTTYGGGVWVCSPGYAGLYNEYYFSNQEIYYNPQLGLYCSPVDGSSTNTFLFAKATDHFSLNGVLTIGDVEYQQSAGVEEGESEYGFTATFYDMFDDLYFGFDMELG